MNKIRGIRRTSALLYTVLRLLTPTLTFKGPFKLLKLSIGANITAGYNRLQTTFRGDRANKRTVESGEGP